MRISSIDFQREKGSTTEKGLLMETDTECLIVDLNGKPIEDLVWDYSLNYDLMFEYEPRK